MAEPDRSTILHISTEDEWVAAQRAGEIRTSTRDRPLDEEGFIHCSSDDQVLGVANAFYADVNEPLVVLRIAVERLPAPVRWENLDGGAETFPHVYGPVPVDAVVSVSSLRRADDGAFERRSTRGSRSTRATTDTRDPLRERIDGGTVE
jgi:uncharacterized protein (DUF952 family)